MFRIKDREKFIRSATHALYRAYKETQTPEFQAGMVELGATKAAIQIDRIIEEKAEMYATENSNIEDMRNYTFAKYRKEIVTNAYELARCLGNEQAKEYFGEQIS